MEKHRLNLIAECCCGQLQIEVMGSPEMNGICHCDNCKKRTGSAFGQSAYFNNKQVVEIRGESSCYAIHKESQRNEQKRYFCSVCGTTLYWTVSSSPELTGVAAGCFVKTPLGAPSYSAAHDRKQAWLTLPSEWQTIASQ